MVIGRHVFGSSAGNLCFHSSMSLCIFQLGGTLPVFRTSSSISRKVSLFLASSAFRHLGDRPVLSCAPSVLSDCMVMFSSASVISLVNRCMACALVRRGMGLCAGSWDSGMVGSPSVQHCSASFAAPSTWSLRWWSSDLFCVWCDLMW